MAKQEKLDRNLVRTATAVIVGSLAIVFNTTIVSVALPTLVTKLNSSIDVVQWVSTGYLLALFVTIPIAGWAQNKFGGKQLWVAALLGFLVTSVLCGFAWNITSLIVFRILQGLAGGFIMPLMTTLIMQATGGKNIGRVMSTISLPAALGPILGPVVGGLILSAFDWQWMFFINIPFCLVGVFLAIRMIPVTQPGAPKKTRHFRTADALAGRRRNDLWPNQHHQRGRVCQVRRLGSGNRRSRIADRLHLLVPGTKGQGLA